MKLLLPFILLTNLTFSKPFIPSNFNNVIHTLEENQEAQKITLLLKQIALEPDNLVLVDRLLSTYIQSAKKSGNNSYIGYAEAFVAPYLIKYPKVYHLKMHQVNILQYTHRFDEALNILQSIIVTTPQEAESYLVKASIYQAKEDFKASLSTCKRLIFRSSHLLSSTCITTAQSHLGKLEESYTLLQDVYAKAENEDLSEKLWALTSLADMAHRLNKPEESLAYLEEVLENDRNDYYALKKMSDIYLLEKEYLKVKELLTEYQHIEALFLRQTVARSKLGDSILLEKENLKSFLALLKLRNETAHKEDIPYFRELGLL
ncbi:MAG: Unknown protein [uncultured Sulfurovum sp.]|uniref:Uncharacterized protein n=1 Tax=uncultured Sulfurovum sp. TaxID=269237 RepID=A0A6S6UJ35_9BACT|nr:MAG: Unknown protein [uncultured Sulfurovum sp.]